MRILSSLFHVSDFRLANVAFHSKLEDEKRGEIKETAIVYIINPTDENLKILIEDCSKQLYDFIFLEFLSPISNTSLKSLACELTKVGQVERIMRI